MKLDPARTGMFRVDWLVPLDATTQDDYSRAIAEKAAALLRSAEFVSAQQLAGPHDVEVRVWVEAAVANGCVSITWEPGEEKFGFHLLDESLKERLGCVVFEGVPCVDGGESLEQADLILDAAMRAVLASDDAESVAARVRDATHFRVVVKDAREERNS